MAATERLDTFVRTLGLDAYRVGGSVRDEILGRKSKDCDYVIRDAGLPEVYAALNAAGRRENIEKFAVTPLKLRDGRQAGWRMAGRGYGLVEFVLPRTEVSTGPGHRDFEIVLSPSLDLETDAQRRDFTFNALYYGPLREGSIAGLIDPLGGAEDLMRRRVQVTHADSFRDDPLRTLRALRFLSTLDYELSAETYALMCAHADAVTGLTTAGVSGTVVEEFSKLLMGQNPAKALRVARDTGVLAVALPELAPMLGFEQNSRYHDLTTDEHTFKALETASHVDAPLRVRWALLFHDSGKPESMWIGPDGRSHFYAGADGQGADHEIVGERIWRKAAKRLNAPAKLRDDVSVLIRNHMVSVTKVNPVKVRRERVRLGDSLLRDLYLMRLCDLSGKGAANKKHMETVGFLEKVRAAAEAESVPCSAKDLLISGHDLIAEGFEGEAIGRALRGVLDEVVCQPSGVRLERDWQLERARKLA